MVASRQLEIPYYRRVGKQRVGGFGALAQVNGRTAIPFLRKYIVPAAKRIGSDMLKFAAPEIGEVISGRKSFKSAAKSVGKQTLKKQLGEGSRRRKGAAGRREPSVERILRTRGREVVNRGESFQQKLLNNPVGHEETFLKHFSLIMSNNNFRYQPFVAASGNLEGNVLIVEDVLSSHEQEFYPSTSLDENCIEFDFQTDRNY